MNLPNLGSSGGKLEIMSHKPARIKWVNLENDMPTVEQARLRMQYELQSARQDRFTAIKLIHGYGSSGVGGALRVELQKELLRLAGEGAIRAFIPGEEWRISDSTTWALLQRFPEWKKDPDLGRKNQGISIVIL
jgi:hypothetical protein